MPKRGRAAPHAKVTADRRVLSPDEKWAASIRERILADCHPWQRDAVVDPSRRVSLLVGRGGAKTTTMRAREALKLTSIRGAELLYLATTKKHAKKLNWSKLQDANEHYGLELRFKESDLSATCKRTGAVLVMSGMEDDADIERYRGYPFNEVDVDEAASHDPERVGSLLERIVGPRMGERKGCIVLGGTPGSRLAGEFYDATRPGSARHSPYADRDKPSYKKAYWSSHAWWLKQIVDLPRAAELYPAIVANWEEALVEKAEKGWSDDNPIWMREYMGLWAADDTGRVFGSFRAYLPDGAEWNIWDPFGERPLSGIQALTAAIAKLREMGLRDLHYVVPADSGHTDPFACSPLAFSPTDKHRRIFQVMDFEQTQMHAKPVAELLIGPEAVERVVRNQPMEPLGGVLGITGWPDGMIIDTDGTMLDELGKVYGLRFTKADRNAGNKAGGIALANGDFHEGRLKLLKNGAAHRQCEQLQWRENQFGQVKEDPRQANHSSDTIVYGRKLIAHLFDSGVVEQDATTAPVDRPAARPQPASDPDPTPGIGTDNEYEGLLAPTGYVDIWGNG